MFKTRHVDFCVVSIVRFRSDVMMPLWYDVVMPLGTGVPWRNAINGSASKKNQSKHSPGYRGTPHMFENACFTGADAQNGGKCLIYIFFRFHCAEI